MNIKGQEMLPVDTKFGVFSSLLMQIHVYVYKKSDPFCLPLTILFLLFELIHYQFLIASKAKM